MDYCKNIIKKVFLLGMLMVMLGLFHSNQSAAVSGLSIDSDAAEQVKINALIMEVNTIKSYIIVAEKRFDISEFKIGSKVYNTSLLDKNGNTIQLNDFKEGQRVLVKGFELPNGVTVAESVQKVPNSKKGNRY